MCAPLVELEGTTEDIQRRLADFAGQRLHVTVQPLGTADTNTNDSRVSQRPIGLCQGQFIVPASFFDPLPEYLQAAFEGDQ